MDVLDTIDKVAEGSPNILWLKTSIGMVEFYGNIVLSIAIWMAITVIGVITCIDLFYLFNPTFQEIVNDKANSKGKDKILISYDAYKAATDSAVEGKNIYMLYFMYRMKTHLIVAFLLSLIYSGAYDSIKLFILRVLKDILGVLLK